MKWCISYKANSDILQKVDEIRFSDFNELLSRAHEEAYAEKRFILEVLDFSELKLNNKPMTVELMESLIDGMDNLYIDFYRLDDLIDFATGRTHDSSLGHYMFHFGVDNYNLLNALLACGVSDVSIDEPLAFDIKNVEHYIHYDNPEVRIRMRPYLGRPSWLPTGDDMSHFWVLPQHIKYYEPYVYVIDLLADNIVREEALYKQYSGGEYLLDMAALIEHFDTDPPVKGIWIDDALALRRLECRQICQSTKPNRCHLCRLEHQMLKMMPRAALAVKNETESQS